MVKYRRPKRPSLAELRARVREATQGGLGPKDALAWAMAQLNRAYNPKTYRAPASPWKKPPGFDHEWWNGRLLRVRLGVKPTKQEVKRARENRARFMQMVRRTERGHTIAVHPLEERAGSVSPASVRSAPRIKRALFFEEELLPEASEASVFSECLGAPDEDVICSHSDRCSSVILSAKNV